MGFPKPIGPYQVSFADFELRRTQVGNSWAVKQDTTEFLLQADCQQAPLMRFFYPTPIKTKWSLLDRKKRCWMPSILYTWGFACRSIYPSSCLRRFVLWIITCILHLFAPIIQASVAQPLLVAKGEGDEGRLPVVIFSHGMWACRTTYTATCCDIASHGYIEHLDGSAVMAQYTDERGKQRWIEHAYADKDFDDTPMEERSRQLKQRIGEIRKVVDVLESLDGGLIAQNLNTVKGKCRLDVSMLQGRLNLSLMAIHGHSFGASTAVVACGVDKRFKCCVAEDVWWQPVEQVDFDRLAGKVPLLFLNTEMFDWEALRDFRNMFLKARAGANTDGAPLITELLTIKGTAHMDQSDFPLIYPIIFRKAGLSGKLDTLLAKDINSRACLNFLHKNLLPPGTGAPYAVDMVKEDGEHLIIGEGQV